MISHIKFDIQKFAGDNNGSLTSGTSPRVTFYKVLDSQVSSITPVNGQLIFTTDTKKIYLDTSDSLDGRKLLDGMDTKYTAGTGLSLNGTEFSNAGVRGISSGSTNGTISVNTNGTSAEVSVAGLGSLAYKSSLTASEVGAIATTAKGANSGVAELDSSGKVPSSQLPSYVDDVIEGYYYNSKFYEEAAHTTEITPETGKIYVDLSTNKTYRWSGSAYVTIASDLALGETSSTAYRGDRGKTAYDHATDSGKLTTAQTSGFYKIATTAEGHVAGVSSVAQSDVVNLGVIGQYSSLPTAASDNVGKIVQYTGSTTSSLTQGYFYICINSDGNYSWENINVQPGGSGGTYPALTEQEIDAITGITLTNIDAEEF